MRIRRISLPSTDITACLAFYRDVMQLPVSGDVITAGWTAIQVVPADVGTGSLHLAFNIAPARFDAACEWLGRRAMLLRDPEGEERFPLEGLWQSRSVYFAGPHGAVLELIGRRALATPSRDDGLFHGSEIACVSEVGLPADDVQQRVDELAHRFRMPVFGEPLDGFAPVGDHEGMLILVDRKRRWFPEGRQEPGALGLHVELEGFGLSGNFASSTGWSLSVTMNHLQMEICSPMAT